VIIKIKNLRLKAIIGVYESERIDRQDIIVNVDMEFDCDKAIESDHISETIDYDIITKRIMQLVESSRYFLLEKLATNILKLIIEENNITKARVEVDKPNAIPLADSVSAICNYNKYETNENKNK